MNEAGGDTAASATQNADGTNEQSSQDDETMGAVTVAELKRRINHVQEKQAVEEQDTMVSSLAVLGADPKSFRREKKAAVR